MKFVQTKSDNKRNLHLIDRLLFDEPTFDDDDDNDDDGGGWDFDEIVTEVGSSYGSNAAFAIGLYEVEVEDTDESGDDANEFEERRLFVVVEEETAADSGSWYASICVMLLFEDWDDLLLLLDNDDDVEMTADWGSSYGIVSADDFTDAVFDEGADTDDAAETTTDCGSSYADVVVAFGLAIVDDEEDDDDTTADCGSSYGVCFIAVVAVGTVVVKALLFDFTLVDAAGGARNGYDFV